MEEKNIGAVWPGFPEPSRLNNPAIVPATPAPSAFPAPVKTVVSSGSVQETIPETVSTAEIAAESRRRAMPPPED